MRGAEYTASHSDRRWDTASHTATPGWSVHYRSLDTRLDSDSQDVCNVGRSSPVEGRFRRENLQSV